MGVPTVCTMEQMQVPTVCTMEQSQQYFQALVTVRFQREIFPL